MSSSTTQVCICGGGNAAHVLVALLGARPERYRTHLLSLHADEAERFDSAMSAAGGVTAVRVGEGDEHVGRAALVTKDPAKALPGSHVIIFVLPAFGHGIYLEAIREHFDFDTPRSAPCVLGALPGASGFDMQAISILGDRAKAFTLFVSETLPWATRFTHYGSRVEILGTKKEVDMAVAGSAEEAERAQSLLQDIIGALPKLCQVPCMLMITLENSQFHTCITYARYRDWDGEALDEPPLFYEGLDEWGAELLDSVSTEIQDIKAILEEQHGLDLTGLVHVKDWISRAYAGDMSDTSSLQRMINTNKGYRGLTHATIQLENGKFMPDFSSRYVQEDFPFGLVVTKGVADLIGIATPNIDSVIRFGERIMGKEYLDADNHVSGKDIGDTRAPQAFGFSTIEELVEKCGYVRPVGDS